MKKKKFFKTTLIVLEVLFLILILLIAINFKVWQYVEKKEIKTIPLIDKCSVLFGTILHTIKDESSCENYCRSECLTRKIKFYNSEFTLNQEGCNTCICNCK
jgi:predicted negative regulator of RcsB-dependent stress response